MVFSETRVASTPTFSQALTTSPKVAASVHPRNQKWCASCHKQPCLVESGDGYVSIGFKVGFQVQLPQDSLKVTKLL